MFSLQTKRLYLRQLTIADAPFILRLLNEPSFLHFIGDRGVRTVADAQTYITEGPLASYAQFGFGLYLVTLRDGGASMGLCGLLRRETLEDVDIGFAYLPEYWGKGVATEAAAAVLDYGRHALRITRIVGITAPDNEGSARVLQKLGLTYQRLIRLTPDGPESKLFA